MTSLTTRPVDIYDLDPIATQTARDSVGGHYGLVLQSSFDDNGQPVWLVRVSQHVMSGDEFVTRVVYVVVTIGATASALLQSDDYATAEAAYLEAIQ